MFARRSLLTLAAVVLALAAAAQSRAQSQSQCSSDSYGTINDKHAYLQRVVLSPGLADWDVKIPADQVCRNQYGPTSFPVGVVVQACVADVAPVVSVTSHNDALVLRRGSLQSVATVETVVYCQVIRVDRPKVGERQVDVGVGRPASIPSLTHRPRVSLFVRPRNS